MLRKPRIINAELDHMLASMRHTDILLVTDAGFPIPSDAWAVDVSITSR
jgi:simple sugar transport system permease protein/D-ribose pyranase